MHWYCVGLLWNGADWYCPKGCLEVDGFPRLGVLGIFYRHRQVRGALGEVLLQGDLADVDAQNRTLGLMVQRKHHWSTFLSSQAIFAAGA